MPSRQYSDKSRARGVRQRFCNHDWFVKFPFTAFSVSTGGIFCLPCVLFLQNKKQVVMLVLVTRPLVNWKDAVVDLTTHSHLVYYLTSEPRMEAFLQMMACPSKQIDMLLYTAMQEEVKKNQAILTSILKCVELCGRQAIVL